MHAIGTNSLPLSLSFNPSLSLTRSIHSLQYQTALFITKKPNKQVQCCLRQGQDVWEHTKQPAEKQMISHIACVLEYTVTISPVSILWAYLHAKQFVQAAGTATILRLHIDSSSHNHEALVAISTSMSCHLTVSQGVQHNILVCPIGR